MRLSQLRILLAVADHGSFTAAAAHTGISQPAVSRAIAALEGELAARLITRQRDGAVLTEAGRRAVVHARTAVHHIDLVKSEVAATTGEVAGELRLASLPTAAGTLMAPLLREFTDRYPQVRVQLLEGFDRDVRSWLERGAIELGVVTLPAPGFTTTELGSDEMMALLPPDHPLARESVTEAVEIAALANEPFILSTGGCRPVILHAVHEAGADLTVAYEAGELSAIEAMVGQGLGISVVPTLGRKDSEAVVTRPLRPPVKRTLALAFAGSEPGSPAARALYNLASNERMP
ncbi:LysR family transcriptional regulator [Nocardia sp. NPDC049707]|uniref:LysR family transcriptional regulator n=1 Tax=Nocardia sp. NPDC049707 TaxID=3154735 RepID=UPI00342E21A0